MGLGASAKRRQSVENRVRSSFTVTSADSYNLEQADVAQLVEQSIRNRQVIGSSPIVGSIFSIAYRPSVHRLLHNCCTLDSFFEPFHRIRGVFTGRLDVKALSRADAFMPENGLSASVGHAKLFQVRREPATISVPTSQSRPLALRRILVPRCGAEFYNRAEVRVLGLPSTRPCRERADVRASKKANCRQQAHRSQLP